MKASRVGRRAGLALLLAAVAGALLLVPQVRHLGRRAAASALASVRLAQRRRLPKEAPLFSHLAASQVGYAPHARKEFTSPTPFASFRVVDEATGQVAFTGGGPAKAVDTRVLGPFARVYTGDFTPLSTPGRYLLLADNGLQTLPFSVAPDVFAAPLRAVQRWFYYQRAFAPVAAPYAEGPWVHKSDEAKAPAGVRGGWHDAGDFSIYSAYLNAALFWLLQADADFQPEADDTHLPESGNGRPDLLDEARWGLEWLLSTQEATTGGFRNTSCLTGYGPYGTNTPNSVPPYANGEVGTLATARAVGNLAFASTLYKAYDAAFAQRCLRAAEAGVAYLETHPGATDGPSCPSARRDGDMQVGRRARSFAAAGMLLATSEARFAKAFEDSFAEPVYDMGYLHLEGQAALLYLRAPAADAQRKRDLRAHLRAAADVALAEGAQHPFGWAGRYHWGSLGAGFLRAALFSIPMCLQNPTLGAADCEQALASLHYAFGRNIRQLCYVTGLPGVTEATRWGFHQWLQALDASPRDFPGMVAGGPNQVPEAADVSTPQARPVPSWGYFGDPAFPRDAQTPLDARYTDNDSWSTNEASVEWQGEAVYLLHFAHWYSQTGARQQGR